MDNQETNTLIAQSSGISAIIEVTKEATFNPIVTIDTKQLGDKTLPAQIPLHFDPESHLLCSITSQLDDYRDTPKHRTGTAYATNLQSFIDLTNRHKSPDSTVIFTDSNMPTPHITAVIDYHTKDKQPQNLSHKIHYNFPITEEYSKWHALDGKDIAQDVFATFLTQQIVELASPTDEEKQQYCEMFHIKTIAEPTELLELAKNLEITVKSNITNGFNPSTGERVITFSEQHDETKTKSKSKSAVVQVPSLFIVSVAAFVDSEQIRFPTRLSYRVAREQIYWKFEMFRPHNLLKYQIQEDIKTVAEKTDLVTFEGKPEA